MIAGNYTTRDTLGITEAMKKQVTLLVLVGLCAVLPLAPLHADAEVQQFIGDLERGLTLSNYLTNTGLRAVLPVRFGRDIMENSRGTRVGFQTDFSGDIIPESDGIDEFSFDKDQLSLLMLRLEAQFYEIPVTRFLQLSGRVRYVGESTQLEGDLEGWQLFRSLSDKRIPNDGIPLFPGDGWAVEYFPLGSLSVSGSALLFNHLAVGYGFENYDYAWTAFSGGGRFSARSALRGDKTATHPGIRDYGRFRISTQNASVDLVDILAPLGVRGTGPVSLYNTFTYSNDAYLGSHHFFRTGLPWVPAMEHTVFEAYGNLNVFSPFVETPVTTLGSVSFKPSFYSYDPSWGSASFKLAEYDLFYNMWAPIAYLFTMISHDPDAGETFRETIGQARDQKSTMLRGGTGGLFSLGVGLTETYLYPYSVQQEPLEFSGGHRSWYFSTNVVFAAVPENLSAGNEPASIGAGVRRAGTSVLYFDLMVRGNSLDRVPSMLNLSDQGGVYFILSFGLSAGL